MVVPIAIVSGAATQGFQASGSVAKTAADTAASTAAKSLTESEIQPTDTGLGGGMGGAPMNGARAEFDSAGNPHRLAWQGDGAEGGKKVGPDRQAPLPESSRSTIQKIGDFLKEHKIGDKVHTIARAERSLNHFGTDMMGPDAKKYNIETEAHRNTPRWP
jgi:hypothetical protein